MRQKSVMFNNTICVQDSPCVLKSVRFFPDDSTSELIIFDSQVGANPNQKKARFNQGLPSIDFGERSLRRLALIASSVPPSLISTRR